jgi:Putative peptidoglycan binding domain
MKRIVLVLTGMLIACSGVRAFILDEEIFSHRSVDSLAPRDDQYLLHQMPTVRDTDYAHRDSRRWVYYFKTNEQLMADPAYVAALQRDLKRLGYYCGQINGVFSDEVSFAIARLQKNYSMRVTGELNGPVRRALHLP